MLKDGEREERGEENGEEVKWRVGMRKMEIEAGRKRRKQWRKWENQRWAGGFREVMICLAACAQPPPQWQNRTMYSKGFKYLFSDLMFLHTQIQLRAWKERKLHCLS